MQTSESKMDQKIKPIVNVRKYPGPTKSVNNTAFYFKTEKNYHFVTVNEKTLHLEVKSISVGNKTNNSYTQYLSFGPEELDHCPIDVQKKTHQEGFDCVDASTPTPVKKTAITTSPMSDIGTGSKKSTSSSSGSTPSSAAPSPCDNFKFESAEASDSGVEEGPKDGRDNSPPSNALIHC